MVKPLGGRGQKAPYQTIQMRVPVPLHSQFTAEIERYRTAVMTGDKPEYRFSVLEGLAAEILTDPAITRNGKDKGACKRALDALIQRFVQN